MNRYIWRTLILCGLSALALFVITPLPAPGADKDAGTGDQSAPADPPKDDTVDWLLDQAAETTGPKEGERPAGDAGDAPPSPFADKKEDRHLRRGVITLSNGEQVRGRIATTRGKPLRVWDAKKRRYRDVPFHLVRSAEAEVVWERDEREWHFKESGSDVKEYSGKTYPARELRYKLTLLNGQSITGGVVAPLYVERRDEDPALFTLNKRIKGEVGQTLDELLYVTRVEFEAKPAKGKPAAKGAKPREPAEAKEKTDGAEAKRGADKAEAPAKAE